MNNILNEFKRPIKDFRTNFNKIVSIILLSLLVTLLNLCPPIIIKNIIDIGILEKNLKLFLSFIIFLLVISIITPILDYILSIISRKVHNSFISKKRTDVLKTLDNQNLEDINNLNIGKVIRLFNSDIPLIANFYTYNLYSILSNLVTAIFSIYILILIELKLFFIITLIQTILILLSKLIDKKIENIVSILNKRNDFLNLKLNDILSKINYLIVTNFYNKQEKLLDENSNDILNKEYCLEKLQRLNFSTSSLFQSIIFIFIYLYCGINIIENNMTMGELLMFTMYSSRYISPISRLIQMKVSIIQISKSIKRLYDFINIRTINKESYTVFNLEDDIIFEDIKFAYNDVYLFDKVNIRLKSKSFNIIKGTSGIGKTSLINILLGYIKLESGNIYLGETDINSIDIKEFRNNISYISQNVEIFYDTLRNNIKMYIDKNINDLEILNALQNVGLEKYTKNIKSSLDSMILSDGKNISGGEAQRIALCRALVQNRSIIILDEVTANLDKKTEKEIISCIKTLFTNKTVVIITHSNEFDDIADNIIDLNKIKKLEKIY